MRDVMRTVHRVIERGGRAAWVPGCTLVSSWQGVCQRDGRGHVRGMAGAASYGQQGVDRWHRRTMGAGRLSVEPRWVGVMWGWVWAWGCVQPWEFVGTAQGRGSAQELGMWAR